MSISMAGTFQALSERLKFTVRRHKFNKDSLFATGHTGAVMRTSPLFTEVTETGSYLRLIDSCITQLKAQGPSRTCNESKEDGVDCVTGHTGAVMRTSPLFSKTALRAPLVPLNPQPSTLNPQPSTLNF